MLLTSGELGQFVLLVFPNQTTKRIIDVLTWQPSLLQAIVGVFRYSNLLCQCSPLALLWIPKNIRPQESNEELYNRGKRTADYSAGAHHHAEGDREVHETSYKPNRCALHSFQLRYSITSIIWSFLTALTSSFSLWANIARPLVTRAAAIVKQSGSAIEDLHLIFAASDQRR